MGKSKEESNSSTLTQEEEALSSSPTPNPGPPMFANAFRHLAAATLTIDDLSTIPIRIMIRNASVYAEAAAAPPQPSKAF